MRPSCVRRVACRPTLLLLFLAGDRVSRMPAVARRAAAKKVLARVCRAYGRMILGEGLFQADSHPGNIFVRRGGKVALLDYGQSKQLPEEDRLAFARLVLRLEHG